MPQATPELREEWGIMDGPAIQFLEQRGYLLTEAFEWRLPSSRIVGEITPKEGRAILFLFEEWDFGGIEETS